MVRYDCVERGVLRDRSCCKRAWVLIEKRGVVREKWCCKREGGGFIKVRVCCKREGEF